MLLWKRKSCSKEAKEALAMWEIPSSPISLKFKFKVVKFGYLPKLRKNAPWGLIEFELRSKYLRLRKSNSLKYLISNGPKSFLDKSKWYILFSSIHVAEIMDKHSDIS